jgi:hypothetical protein
MASDWLLAVTSAACLSQLCSALVNRDYVPAKFWGLPPSRSLTLFKCHEWSFSLSLCHAAAIHA